MMSTSLLFLAFQDNLFVKKRNVDGVTTYDGFAVAFLKRLAENAGFTYTIYEAPDGNFGVKNASGKWNGMIGELVSKVSAEMWKNRWPKDSCILQCTFCAHINILMI